MATDEAKGQEAKLPSENTQYQVDPGDQRGWNEVSGNKPRIATKPLKSPPPLTDPTPPPTSTTTTAKEDD